MGYSHFSDNICLSGFVQNASHSHTSTKGKTADQTLVADSGLKKSIESLAVCNYFHFRI